MAAVLLAGAPLCNEAFAGVQTPVALTSTASISSGLKFVLTDNPAAPSAYVKVADVADTNYVTFTATDANSIEEAAVFEIRSFAGGKFQLWVNGKQFVTNAAGNAYSPANPNDIVKEFVPKASTAATTKCNFDNIWTYQVGGTGAAVWTVAKPATVTESFDASDFNSYNSNATTLSFDAPNLVGNVFESLVPVTLSGSWGGKFSAGTYFVSGSADDIKAFIKSGATATNIQRAAAKLKFAFISGSKYELNAAKAGEAYSLIMLPGSEFYKTTDAANPDHAKFTAKTLDNLNNEGVIQLSANVTVGTNTYAVNIAAVKTSGSDASSYVTTVLQSGSAFSSVNPTLGSNTYIAASEFLSSKESVYNIYFTSGKESVKDGIVTEYHKYLAVTSDGSSFEAHALAANDIQLDSPLAQWVATGFDGRYTLTLTNRQTQQDLVLKLQPTTTPGVYEINGNPSSGDFTVIANLDDKDGSNLYAEQDLGGKLIKLIKTTTTKTDGFLELSKDEMASPVVLAFSGESAALGETTFYAAHNATTHKLYPTQNADKAVWLNISKAEDRNGDALYVLNELNYAYLDAKGVVATDKVDTLAMPVYNLSYSYPVSGVTQTDVVTSQDLSMTQVVSGITTTPVDLFFQKAMDGSYVMTNTANPGASLADIKSVGAGWNVTGVQNSGFALNYTNLFAPEADHFANITVILYTNEDRTSLEAVSRHATLKNKLGSVSLQENENGILEGILAAEGLTFWLDTADSETAAPAFYISKGIAAEEEETPATKADEAPAMRNFLFYAADSLHIFNEGSAMATTNEAYRLENTSDLKAIFRPAALIAEDTLATVVDGKEVTLKNKAVKPFQFGIVLADEDVEGEYVIYSKANPYMYLYSHNGKLGFGGEDKAMIFKIGEGDATANEAIAAESGIEVIGGQGVVTVQGAAGKVITVANILGQTIANQVAASDNVTIAAPAGVVVVAVDGEATKVVVK